MTVKPTKRLLGRILSDGGFISRRDLKRALSEQKRTGELLCAILVRIGAIRSEELEFVLPMQRDLSSLEGAARLYKSGRFDLHRMLVNVGRISAAQFEKAKRKHRKTKKDIGEILVEEGAIDHNRLAFVESLHKKTMAALFVAVFSLASVAVRETANAQTRDAGVASGAVGVTAIVEGHAAIRVISQATELVVTNADAERGYVEMPLGSIIEVRTNSRAGYALVFEPMRGPFRAIELNGLQRTVEVSENGGWVVEPYPGRGPHTLELGYKFFLSEDTQPGTYAWPVKMNVKPL